MKAAAGAVAPSLRVPKEPYVGPSSLGHGLLRLDGNEGAQPPAGLLKRLSDRDVDLLRAYPDTAPLERELACAFGIELDRVLVTAGADDAIDRCCRAYLDVGREVIVATPTFEMIHRFAGLAGGVLRSVPWTDGFPTEAVGREINPATTLVAIVSPNNPTGRAVTAEDLVAVSRAASNRALVLLDHVYVEYAEDDLTDLALALGNVIVVRTFSKAWGLAGCRVGYALAEPSVIATLRNAGNPYPVAALSMAAAMERMRTGRPELAAHVARIRTERAELTRILTMLGTPPHPSQGNFVFVDFGRRVAFVYHALGFGGVRVRWFSKRQETATSLRITLPGNQADFETLVGALEGVLAPQALVLRVDRLLEHLRRSEGVPAPLARLARRLPVALLTDGSPGEVQSILAVEGLRNVMVEPVTGPDGSASPGRRALSCLGVQRGWLVSDTAEGVRGAAADGVIPLGLLAGTDASMPHGDALHRAGATAVVRSLDELGELIP